MPSLDSKAIVLLWQVRYKELEVWSGVVTQDTFEKFMKINCHYFDYDKPDSSFEFVFGKGSTFRFAHFGLRLLDIRLAANVSGVLIVSGEMIS